MPVKPQNNLYYIEVTEKGYVPKGVRLKSTFKDGMLISCFAKATTIKRLEDGADPKVKQVIRPQPIKPL